MAQLGVFLTPPPQHPFYQITSGILGYDIWAQRHCPSSLADHLDADTLKLWLGEAPIFGIHCTIGGAALFYDEADVDEIKARLAWIASRTTPFGLVNGRFFDDFHANPGALVSTFDSPDGAIQRLHRQVVTIVSPLHTDSRYASAVPHLDERPREIYYRTGDPWALELFTPHWSLMTGTPDRASWDTARELLASRTSLFSDQSTSTLEVTDIQLVRRGEDGYFTVIGSFPLRG